MPCHSWGTPNKDLELCGRAVAVYNSAGHGLQNSACAAQGRRQLEWCDARCRLAAANTLMHLAVIVVADYAA